MDREDNDEIKRLREENDRLKDEIVDLNYHLQRKKDIEAIEFIRELYHSLKEVDEKLTKEEIVENLKKYIQVFAKDNYIML